MEVTWQLRPDVRWHDGTRLTADDLRFSWEVAADPATAIGKRGPAEAIEQIDVVDPATVVMHWKRPSPYGGELGPREFPIFPRQLLRAAFLDNKAAFHQHPYFTSPEGFSGGCGA